MSFRDGLGIDFHRYRQGRKLILGGAQFEYPLGLFGHSDADVVAHAVADAVLGAAKLGDIGKHFPDTDPKYKGANSIGLLKQCALMAEEREFKIVNVDVMVVLEEPKISPRIPEMEKNLAQAMGIGPEEVSVKATRPERMGAVGKKEGVACYAVCLLEKK